jgi:hypothetical protein
LRTKRKNVSRNVLQTLAKECSSRSNPNKVQGSKVADSWMDINKGIIVNKTQSGD